ncbi:hypothetical protein [Streptomyces sp. NBC_01304]|uniref:hypothetical protein n=1 Tax=Streptomyces sp. NBC_01304 TaxID=2903818 RepID=UPI002E11BB2F|nr:hypothetical protein OG430_19080 [Streptomyces sp. NBC_01304]
MSGEVIGNVMVAASGAALMLVLLREQYEKWLRKARPWRSERRLFRLLGGHLSQNLKSYDPDALTATAARFGRPFTTRDAELEKSLRLAVGYYAGLLAWGFVWMVESVAFLAVTVLLEAGAPDEPWWVGGALTYAVPLSLVIWLVRDAWFFSIRRLRSLEAPALLQLQCCDVLMACKEVADGESDVLALDREVERVVRSLSRFAEAGHVYGSPKRKRELAEYIARVQHALRAAVADVFRDGTPALDELARKTVTLAERSGEGRWLALLDEADTQTAPLPEPLPSRARRAADAAIILLMVAATAGAIWGLVALKISATAISVIAPAILLGLGLAWRGPRLGLSPTSVFGSVTGNLTQPPTPQPPAQPGPGNP